MDDERITPMWVTIRDILTSANATVVLIFLLAVIFIVAKAIRSGTINLHTGVLDIGKIGKSIDDERELIRQQVKWLELFIADKYVELAKYKENDEFHTKYVLEKMFDEVIEWVLYNHITTRGEYVKIKQDLMWRLIKGLTYADVYHTDEFKQYVYDQTETVILHLIQIKKDFYSKQG